MQSTIKKKSSRARGLQSSGVEAVLVSRRYPLSSQMKMIRERRNGKSNKTAERENPSNDEGTIQRTVIPP